jgi:hypothetical protein
MAIKYKRAFQHVDWIDNEDVVEAGGPKGFNQKFHDLEGEFDSISTAFGTVDTAFQGIPQLAFVTSGGSTTVPAGTASAEFPVEGYSTATIPANLQRLYYAVIIPISGSTSVVNTFLYRVLGSNVTVTLQFFNPTASPATFAFRVLSFALAG